MLGLVTPVSVFSTNHRPSYWLSIQTHTLGVDTLTHTMTQFSRSILIGRFLVLFPPITDLDQLNLSSTKLQFYLVSTNQAMTHTMTQFSRNILIGRILVLFPPITGLITWTNWIDPVPSFSYLSVQWLG